MQGELCLLSIYGGETSAHYASNGQLGEWMHRHVKGCAGAFFQFPGTVFNLLTEAEAGPDAGSKELAEAWRAEHPATTGPAK